MQAFDPPDSSSTNHPGTEAGVRFAALKGHVQLDGSEPASPGISERPDADRHEGDAQVPPPRIPLWRPPNEAGKPRFFEWGDHGPGKLKTETRRRVYSRGGAAVRIEIEHTKDPGGLLVAYRVRQPDGKLGWRLREPPGYRSAGETLSLWGRR